MSLWETIGPGAPVCIIVPFVQHSKAGTVIVRGDYSSIQFITVTHRYPTEAFPVPYFHLPETLLISFFHSLCSLRSGKCQSTLNVSEVNAFLLSV